MLEILKNENATFSYFDILSDNEVREGLKKYSNWPTYPQLYIKGYFYLSVLIDFNRLNPIKLNFIIVNLLVDWIL